MAEQVGALLDKMNLSGEEILMRIMGCPNGCARPYMAKVVSVGDGRDTYRLWLGGSPVLMQTAYPFRKRVKDDEMETTLELILWNGTLCLKRDVDAD